MPALTHRQRRLVRTRAGGPRGCAATMRGVGGARAGGNAATREAAGVGSASAAGAGPSSTPAWAMAWQNGQIAQSCERCGDGAPPWSAAPRRRGRSMRRPARRGRPRAPPSTARCSPPPAAPPARRPPAAGPAAGPRRERSGSGTGHDGAIKARRMAAKNGLRRPARQPAGRRPPGWSREKRQRIRRFGDAGHKTTGEKGLRACPGADL